MEEQKNQENQQESPKKTWSAPTLTSMDTRSTQGSPGPNPTPDGTFFPAS
jgi:hypothetical protein